MIEPALIFQAISFIPHGHCYLWQSNLVALHIAADASIAISYYSIPLTLIYFVQKRKDLPFNWMFLLFGAFIILCGSTHIMGIWTLWHPAYWQAGFLKAITGLVSVVTAFILIPLIPKALALPSPAQLAAVNQALGAEIIERKQIETALRQSEFLLRQQTTELEKILQQLQQTQSQLIQTEKMSSLGQMVAGVAHEINNPVSFIYGNINPATEYTYELIDLLSLYQKYYPNPTPEIQAASESIDFEFIMEDLPKLLSSIKVGAERIRQIVLSLRNFSRLDEAGMKQVDIHEGIDSTLLILQHRLENDGSSGIQVIKEYGKLPLVNCYAGQLNQVFMNILSNAIDALEELKLRNSKSAQFQINALKDDLQSTITTQTVTQEGSRTPWIRIQTELKEPNQVAIRITDNGTGITAHVQERLFDPFFTTKSIGKGTGLGLYISYQIIQKHGGQLKCFSAPIQGAEFVIEIPIQQSHAAI